MLLNELFGGQPLFESSATVQVVVSHIRDMVPDIRAIWMFREGKRAPWNFLVVVHDQIDGETMLAAQQSVKRIEQSIKGVDIRIRVLIESAFEQPEGAMKIYAAPAHTSTVAQ